MNIYILKGYLNTVARASDYFIRIIRNFFLNFNLIIYIT